MPLRYGIIGTGMMGCEHIRNLVKIDGVDVTAVADPNEKPRRWAEKVCGDRFKPRVYENYRDLLASDDVDAVVIASPNFTHIDVMRDVFETDKHVMLEKPMCTTMADCQELVAKAEHHAGLVWVALEYRYMAPVATLLKPASDERMPSRTICRPFPAMISNKPKNRVHEAAADLSMADIQIQKSQKAVFTRGVITGLSGVL